MALIIKSLFGIFWTFSSAFLIYLIYIVMQTESDPSLRLAWMTMTGLTFAAATLLAYVVISAQHSSSIAANAEDEEATLNSTETENDTENTD